ncbi:hypothetical protein ACWGI9_41475 [Streptomyces sp. NPDC054833]
MSQQTHKPSRRFHIVISLPIKGATPIRDILETLVSIVMGAFAGLLRRIEDARTPVPVWDDPCVTASDSDDLRGSGTRRSARILKLSTPKRA